MRHGLAGIRAVVDYKAIAFFLEAKLLGDLRGFQQQMPQHLVIFRFGFGDAGDWLSRDDQDMRWRAWFNVAKGKDLVILVNNLRWNFPIPDAFEECLRHAGVYLEARRRTTKAQCFEVLFVD
jgi:hypothetical protein